MTTPYVRTSPICSGNRNATAGATGPVQTARTEDRSQLPGDAAMRAAAAAPLLRRWRS